MSDVLAKIAAYKREEVTTRKAARTLNDLKSAARAQNPPRGFRQALIGAHAPGHLAMIAEIKKASPSKGLIRLISTRQILPAPMRPVALPACRC